MTLPERMRVPLRLLWWRDSTVLLQFGLLVGAFLFYYLIHFEGTLWLALQIMTGLPTAMTPRGALGLLLVVYLAAFFWYGLLRETLTSVVSIK